MLKHVLTIAVRNFLKYKASFVINAIGLALGISSFILIYLWVSGELSVDRFHIKGENLYQVMSNLDLGDEIVTHENSSLLLGGALQEDFPEIISAVSVSADFCSPSGVISDGIKAQEANGLLVSENFFDVFSFDLVLGDPSQVLSDRNNIVVSEELAVKLFGSIQNSLGKRVTWNYQWDDGIENFPLVISGVFNNVAENSSMQFDALSHISLLSKMDYWAGQWSGSYVKTYVELDPLADLEKMNAKFQNYLSSKGESGKNITPFLQKYEDRYLHNPYVDGIQAGGKIGYVKLMSLLAIFILLLACINFSNLSTAQASRKMKEIGVKKTYGANKSTLIFQFLGESFLLTLFSLILGVGLVWTSLPQFNAIMDKNFSLELDATMLSFLGVLVIVTALVAGSYPAFYLSRFNPVQVLKGKFHVSNDVQFIRKGLVVFQFVVSMVLIIGVLVIHDQISFMVNKNPGYNKKNILHFSMGSNNENPSVFLSELKQIAGVTSVSFMNGTILDGHELNGGYVWNGNDDNKKHLFQSPRVGHHFASTMGMEFVSGRDFLETDEDGAKLILNESAVRLMGIEDPIGFKIKQGNEDKEIIGVVKDFQYGTMHQKMEPLIMRKRNHGREIYIRFDPQRNMTALEEIESLFTLFQPGYSFDFHFIEEAYTRLYQTEIKVAVLSRFFAMFAIVISCLGLLGVAIFSMQRRAKEISVRKILGSSDIELIKLLSSEFTVLVFISMIISMPIGYVVGQKWLEKFAYAVEIQWWYFMVASMIALILSWITVGVQALKVTRRSPVNALKID